MAETIISHDETLKEISQKLWEELYLKKKQGWLTILSGSMGPLIPVNSRILVKPIPLSSIRVGDIIVFKHQNKLISHWVLKVQHENEKTYFLQQGYSASTPDLIDGNNVIGKVFAVTNKGCHTNLNTFLHRLTSLKTVSIIKTRNMLSQIRNLSHKTGRNI